MPQVKLKLLHVVQRFRPALLTGSERYMEAITFYMVARGYDVALVSSTAIDWSAMKIPMPKKILSSGCERYKGLRVYRFRPSYLKGFIFSFYSSIFNKIKLKAPAMLTGFLSSGPLLSGRQLRGLLELLEPDLINATPAPFSYLLLLSKEAKRKGIPFIITPFIHLGLHQYKNPYLVKVFSEASAVIAATECEARVLQRVYGARKSYVVPMGIWTNEWKNIPSREVARDALNIPQDAFVILLPHRAEAKGARQVIEASALLAKKLDPVKVYVLVYGVAPASPRFRALVKIVTSKGVTVRDYGAIDEKTKKILYAASDVLAQPSIADSYGIVYLEAWASSKPVIAADTLQMRHVVRNGIDGFLVPFGDVVSLTKVLTLLATRPNLVEELGRNGRERVFKYHDWSRIGSLIEKVYLDILYSK